MVNIDCEDLKRKILGCASGSGVEIVGFANLEGLKRLLHGSIRDVASELTHGISLGFRLSDTIIDCIEDGPTLLYKQHYKTVNWMLDQCAAKVVRIIESVDAKALPIPASQTVDWEKQLGHLSHKAVAVASGLGWIGKSGLVVNREHGARVRYASVLTNLPFGGKATLQSLCGDCSKCIELCPAGAISEEGYDRERCLSMLKTFARRPGIGVYICGVCVKACPTGEGQSE